MRIQLSIQTLESVLKTEELLAQELIGYQREIVLQRNKSIRSRIRKLRKRARTLKCEK